MALSFASCSGYSAEPLARCAHGGRERPHQARGDHPDADEQQDASHAVEQQDRAGGQISEQPGGERDEQPRVSTIGAAVRLFASREGGSAAPSRTAAIGGTRVARRAGEIVASTVMPTPSSSDTITVRVLNTVPGAGQVDSRTP